MAGQFYVYFAPDNVCVAFRIKEDAIKIPMEMAAAIDIVLNPVAAKEL